jgi:uncharacterized protein
MANDKNNGSGDTARRGLAWMDKNKQREGGKGSGGSSEKGPEHPTVAGEKGGEASHGGKSSAVDSSKRGEGGRSSDKKGGSGERS